ncbi:MAG: DnaJ domain-containing protein [Candidatus Dormibacteraeota bacterium]|nr:DnaJ domain-containing protein [Candidatus Dormibacteraeota bacterium]
MPATKDYYETLGLPRNASQKDIQSAFRRLARQYHPDVRPGDKEAEEMFKRVSQAHAVLADPEKRQLYDRYGEQWQQAGAAGAPTGGPTGAGTGTTYQRVDFDPEDLRDVFRNFNVGQAGGSASFADLFGNMFNRDGGRTARTAHTLDQEVDLSISFHESYAGTHRRVQTPDGRSLELTVPPGVADGTILRAPGIRARVRIRPDQVFQREGRDLRVVVPVPLATALLGGEVDVPTPKGTHVQLRIPRETQNGKRLRLRGLGMPAGKEGAAGDLIAEVDVRLPIPLDDRTRRFAETLLQET